MEKGPILDQESEEDKKIDKLTEFGSFSTAERWTGKTESRPQVFSDFLKNEIPVSDDIEDYQDSLRQEKQKHMPDFMSGSNWQDWNELSPEETDRLYRRAKDLAEDPYSNVDDMDRAIAVVYLHDQHRLPNEDDFRSERAHIWKKYIDKNFFSKDQNQKVG